MSLTREEIGNHYEFGPLNEPPVGGNGEKTPSDDIGNRKPRKKIHSFLERCSAILGEVDLWE